MEKNEYKKFIREVKKAINGQPIPPKYNPEEWENKNFNCYLYALRACMNFDFDGPLIAPGFISRNDEFRVRTLKSNYTKEWIVKQFQTDIKALGLEAYPTEIEQPITSSEYKIAIYCRKYSDYHFARQDSNGCWSEKNGWTKKIAILDTKDVTKNENGYEFIGVFRVSKKEE